MLTNQAPQIPAVSKGDRSFLSWLDQFTAAVNRDRSRFIGPTE